MRLVSASSDPGERNPITGSVGCCARAASGHVAAPLRSVMNSRRLMPDIGPLPGSPIEVGRSLLGPTLAHRGSGGSLLHGGISVFMRAVFWSAMGQGRRCRALTGVSGITQFRMYQDQAAHSGFGPQAVILS